MLQSFLAVTVVVGPLLAGEVLSQQCYNQPNCAGDVVSGATTAEECCVGTDDGMSFGVSGGTCTVSQCIVHGFESARYSVREREESEEAEGQDRVDTTFKLNVKGTTNFGSLSLIGRITSEAGPHADTTDFQPFSTTDQTITAANDIAIQLFSRNDDITLEYDDTVILRFTVRSGLETLIQQLEAAGEYIRDTAIVDIDDNDLLNINFRETDYVVNEGDLQGSIILRLRETQNPFTVTLHPVPITEATDQDGFNVSAFVADVPPDARATPGTDFDTTSITITIPNGTTEFEITYRFFFDDEVNEIDQSFALVGVVGDDVPDGLSCFQRRTGDPLCFGRTGGTTIKIEDNDPMILGFRTDMTIRNEVLGQFPIEVHSKITSEVEYTIGFRHIRREGINIATVETNDLFDPIFDNDFDAKFGDRPNPNMEDDPLETTRLLEVGHLEPLTPLVTTIFSDLRPERNESYVINIFIIDTVTGGGRANYDCNENEDNPEDFFCDHTIYILDDDEPFEVGYVQTIYTVIEDEGPVRVCVNLTKPAVDIEEEMVFVESLDFSSLVSIPHNCSTLAMPDPFDFLTQSYNMIPLSDYEQQQLLSNRIRNIGINATRRVICYDQPIYDDLRLEPAEYFGMTLTVQGMPPTTFLTEVRPKYDQVAICILDNDEAVVGLEKTFYQVSEDVGVVEVCAIVYSPTIVCPIAFPFDVSLSTDDNTAEEPMDYIGLSMILSFAACETRQCVNITIVDDLVDELDEEFDITLERTIGLDSRISLRPVDARVIIEDNDVSIIVGHERTVYTTSEGDGQVELCVVVFQPNGGAPREFTLTITTEDGTAVAPDDYESVVGRVLQFNENEVRKCYTININNDEICENMPNENFFSNLAYDTGVQPITVIRERAEVIIDDSLEPECNIRVGYERTVYTTTEDEGFVTLCAIIYSPLSGGTPRPFTVRYTTADDTAVSPQDYNSSTGILTFNTGDDRQCHDVDIVDDELCEEPSEQFFSNLTLESGAPVTVDPSRAQVIIFEKCEPGVFVNDTLTGDPLMTVPIFNDSSVQPGDSVSSLCYEVHGESNQFFNLISDGCTSVNAFYEKANTSSPNIDLNVVTQIGVTAVGNSGVCTNITVNLEGNCEALVNGGPPASDPVDGIHVKRYASSSRVRISVPNCGDTMLVMWVFCKSGQVEDPVTWLYFPVNFIRYVVMRGLNLDEKSHGLLGQFWNVPVTVTPHNGDFGGALRTDDYVITVDHPDSPPRSFVGLKSEVTWEFEKRVCYYVGNRQAGQLAEVSDPNDSVIEGVYSDYKVDSLFATDYVYSHFTECG